MKEYDEYRNNNTPVDWVIRDMMIEINKLRNNVLILHIIIAILILVQYQIGFSEPDEYQDFLEGVEGVTNVTWGNDTSHLYDDPSTKEEDKSDDGIRK